MFSTPYRMLFLKYPWEYGGLPFWLAWFLFGFSLSFRNFLEVLHVSKELAWEHGGPWRRC